MQVTTGPSTEVGHAQSLEAKHRAGLCPGRDVQLGLPAFDQRDRDPGPEGGLGDADRGVMDQVGVMALEPGVRTHLDLDVEVAGRAVSAP